MSQNDIEFLDRPRNGSRFCSKERFFPCLKTLILANNSLRSLPPSFIFFANLKNLDLSFNYFSNAPTVLQHLQLKEVNLSHNRISTFPFFLVHRTAKIDLSYNKRKPFNGPNSIFDSKNMKNFENLMTKCRRSCICIIGGVQSGKRSVLRCLNSFRKGKFKKLPPKEPEENSGRTGDFDLSVSYLHLKQRKGKIIAEPGASTEEDTVVFHLFSSTKFQNAHFFSMFLSTYQSDDELKEIERRFQEKQLTNRMKFEAKRTRGLSEEVVGVIENERKQQKRALVSEKYQRFSQNFEISSKNFFLPSSFLTDATSPKRTSISPVPNSPTLLVLKPMPEKTISLPSVSSAMIPTSQPLMIPTSQPLMIPTSQPPSVMPHLSTSSSSKFLRPPLIFIVFNSFHLTSEVDRLAHYLNIIVLTSPFSRVLFIGTHLDLWPSSVDVLERYVIVQKWFGKYFKFFLKYLKVLGFVLMNTINGEGSENALQYIIDEFESDDFPYTEVPRSFLLLESYVLSLKRVAILPMMTLNHFIEIAYENSISTDKLFDAYRLLLTSGLVGIPTQLPEFILFDLSQFSRAMSNLFTNRSESNTRLSMFAKDVALKIQSSCNSIANSNYIDVLIKYQLLFQISPTLYFLPSVLPIDPPISRMSPFWPEDLNASDVIGRHFLFDESPPLIMPYIISKILCSDVFDSIECWMNGLLVSNKEGTRYSMVFLNSRELAVYTLGRTPSAIQMFILLTSSVDTFVVDALQMNVTRHTFCPHCVSIEDIKPSLTNLLGCNSEVQVQSPRSHDSMLPPYLLGSQKSFPFSCASYPELYFSLGDVNHLRSIGEWSAICRKGVAIDLSDLVPEYSMEGISKLCMSDFVMEESLGFGSFAEVYRAKHNGTLVALKVLKIPVGSDVPSLESKGTDPASDDEMSSLFSSEFFREVNIMSQLKHPHIVSLMGVVMSPPCLVMEYMDSGSLYDHILSFRKTNRVERSGSNEDLIEPNFTICHNFCYSDRIRFALEIASAMQFLHERHYIHRDLKSPNILLKRSDDISNPRLIAKVADFGTSRQTEFVQTFYHSSVENPRWVAPEIIRGESYTNSVDVYSFGESFFCLFVFELSFILKSYFLFY
jgi:Leucine-rich repeat (LRR) protein